MFASYVAYMWLLLLGFRDANRAAREVHNPAAGTDN